MIKKLKTLDVIYQERIDKYISSNDNLTRNEVQKLILNNAIYVNEKLVRKANFIVRPSQKIDIYKISQKPIKAAPEKMDIKVVYEDDDIAVIDKKSGVVVHPAPGNYLGTLVSGLLHKFENLANSDDQFRPGVVHRLDKDTSGLIVFAKNNEALNFLTNELKTHQVQRSYLAWVIGQIKHKFIHIDLPIGRDPHFRKQMKVTKTNSKWAKTHVAVKKIIGNYTLIECELETGRTHQIRVHLSHIGHPIVGDPVYGKKIDQFGQRLHAYKLKFVHPRSKKVVEFTSKPPKQFDDFF